MLIFHNTHPKYLESILKDGKLKSSEITGKNDAGEGYGIYTTNKFVYLSTCKKIFDIRILSDITLFFNSDILKQKKFYVSTFLTPTPDHTLKSTTDDTKHYQKSYPKKYDKCDEILEELYKKSIKVMPKGKSFQVFQQIAIKDKIKFKDYLVGIDFYSKPSNKLVKYINKNYPNVEINVKDMLKYKEQLKI
jgi:hypothetical protein